MFQVALTIGRRATLRMVTTRHTPGRQFSTTSFVKILRRSSMFSSDLRRCSALTYKAFHLHCDGFHLRCVDTGPAFSRLNRLLSIGRHAASGPELFLLTRRVVLNLFYMLYSVTEQDYQIYLQYTQVFSFIEITKLMLGPKEV